jgi:tetratricopeptide (TPR) repeat protein
VFEAERKDEEALAALSAILKKYRSHIHDESVHTLYNTTRTRYAFLLADLGRYQEARPILESLSEPKTPQNLFYLGYSYLEKPTYIDAERLLSEALELGLPTHLDYRAHCALGMACYELGDYERARIELERGAEKADAVYLKRAEIWKWLEYTCLSLGLKEDAERYARMGRPS